MGRREDFDAMKSRVTEAVGTMASARTLITEQRQRLQTLVDEATDFDSLKSGLESEIALMDTEEDALAAAVAANPTP